jgi:hypothetical protein
MALDHYVSQVHLKNFYSPAMAGLMYAIRKSDLKRILASRPDQRRQSRASERAYPRPRPRT